MTSPTLWQRDMRSAHKRDGCIRDSERALRKNTIMNFALIKVVRGKISRYQTVRHYELTAFSILFVFYYALSVLLKSLLGPVYYATTSIMRTYFVQRQRLLRLAFAIETSINRRVLANFVHATRIVLRQVHHVLR